MNTTALPDLPSYFNAKFTHLPHPKVSVMDRGFVFGDGVYEVVPAYAGKPFRFDEHLARLDRSLGELRIPNPMSRAQWREIVMHLVEAYAGQQGRPASETNQLVYLQLT